MFKSKAGAHKALKLALKRVLKEAEAERVKHSKRAVEAAQKLVAL